MDKTTIVGVLVYLAVCVLALGLGWWAVIIMSKNNRDE